MRSCWRFPSTAPALAAAVAAACVALGISCATGPSPRAAAGAHHVLTRQKAFLYEVSTPGSERVRLYLLGSIHALDRPLALGPELEEILDSADALVFEIDPSALNVEVASQLMLSYGILVPSERLEDLLSAETLAMLRARIGQPDFSPQERQVVQQMRPWAISLLLVEKGIAAASATPGYGVDQYFADRADGRPVVGLETPDEQFFAMSSLSAGLAETMLRQLLEGSGSSDFQEVQALWKRGYEPGLAALLFDEATETDAELNEALFFARNDRMAVGLQELISEHEDRVYLAVVGAGHLVGEDSIPDFLRAEGYRVVRSR